MNQGKYLCSSWQALIQQLAHNLTHGYNYYHYYKLDEKRRDKLYRIDSLMVSRFETDKSKDKRYHHRKAGKANYFYLRYDLMVVILRSEGVETDEKRLEQKFKDIKKEPIEINIGDEIVLKLHFTATEGFTIHFTRTCYRELKYKFAELLEKRQVEQVKYWFNALNGMPAYAGIIEHKRKLLDYILKTAKKHGISLKRTDFRLIMRRKVYKVFEEND
jgi:hypothetical protein